MTFGIRPPSKAVKYLLIINCVAFLLQLGMRGRLESLFAASGESPIIALQVWRLISFQFLHANPIHLLFNMIGLFFLGRILEQSWGAKKFLYFYLTCGTVGGAVFVLASLAGLLSPNYLVGASGGVLGLLVACAVLFPQVVVILLLFPVPIRTAAFLLTALYVLMILSSGPNAGGNLCHLGGMATAFIWVTGKSYFASWKRKISKGAYQRQSDQKQKMQYEVDRILAKVHNQGLQSLTRRERQILQEATEQQKHKNL